MPDDAGVESRVRGRAEVVARGVTLSRVAQAGLVCDLPAFVALLDAERAARDAALALAEKRLEDRGGGVMQAQAFKELLRQAEAARDAALARAGELEAALRKALDKVVFRDAGTNDRFAYLWKEDWDAFEAAARRALGGEAP